MCSSDLKVGDALSGQPYVDQARQYAEAMQNGDTTGADAILAGLPADASKAIESAVESAQASSIAMSMVVLGVVALAGAVFALVVIGRRRAPDPLPAEDLSVA